MNDVQLRTPDWYADPHGEAPLRYWDGEAWTRHTAPLDLAVRRGYGRDDRPWYARKRVLVGAGLLAVLAVFAGLGQIPG